MECIFCSLIRDGAATWVSRGPTASAFAPLDPLAPGHTLVVPTRHYADIFETPEYVLTDTVALVQRVADAMRSALRATGVNILHASGVGSEQSVPHLHFHVVPRWPDDGFSTWPTARSQHSVSDPITQIAHTLSTRP
ncbi:HIT family protein [Streptodolium elevatio]|uniref:HIT family protein n=1 Tax=Streptodolium elevatio TaxID=3157996 RepID=A0ABV3D8U3_9ACTN